MENKIITKGVDILIYLLIIISLCTSVYHIINITFSIIDFKWGDSLTNIYQTYNDSIRMSIATLIVMFPIYFGLSFYVSKLIAKDITRSESRPRKITIFASIFITSITLIGSLISIIYKFLGGELTTSFGLKVFFVILLALIVGGYYLYSLYRDFKKRTSVPKIFAVVSVVLVLASISLGIFVFGTPTEMRDRRYDDQRLSDISTIQNQVLNYWQSHKIIPDNLSQLNDPFQGFSVPIDPQTKNQYEYKIISQSSLIYNGLNQVPSDAKFEICANFVTVRDTVTDTTDVKNMVQPVGFYYNSYDQTPFWNHDIGRACFTRTITKEMYILK